VPANAALSGGDLTNLALSATNGHSCPLYLTYWPDRTVATAEVDTTPSSTSIVEVAVTNESADWANRRAGMRVKIASPGGTLRGYYQIRNTLTSGVIELAEIANADPGIIALNSRTEGIQAGDEITVLEHYDLRSMMPFTTLAGITGQDYDIPVGTYNTLPESIFNATVNAQNGADYAAIVANGATKAMTLTLTETAWPTDVGSVAYSWASPSGWTSLSALNTATLTGNAPVGAHVVYCTITNATDSWQVVKIFFIRIHSPADPPIPVLIDNVIDTETRQWRTKTVRVASGAASVIPPGAFCMLWEDPTWNSADITSATKKMVGYRTGADWLHRPGYHESEVIVTGVCGMLDMLQSTAATLRFTGAVTGWEELAASLSNVAYAIRWILRWRVKNVLERFNFTPFDTSGTLAPRSIIPMAQGSAFQQISRLGDMYEVNVGSRSDGEIMCAYHPSMLEDRSAVVTRVTVTNAHYSSITVNQREHPGCGMMRYEGIISHGLVSDFPTGAQAPGDRQFGQSAKTISKNDKVFDNQTDANRRAGRAFAMETQPITSVMLEFPSNWDVFECADMQRMIVTVPASKSPTGSALELMVIPNTLTKYYLGGNKAKVQLTAEVETDGVEGVYIDIRPADTSAYGNYSDLQETPIEPLPADWGPDGDEVPVEGDLTGLLTAARDGLVSLNGADISPTAEQRESISPTIKMIVDPHNYKRLILYGGGGGLVCDDMFNPSWRAINLASGAPSQTWSKTFDFTATDGDWQDTATFGSETPASAVWTTGVGWEDTDYESPVGSIGRRGANIIISIAASTLTSITLTYTYTKGTASVGADPGVLIGTSSTLSLLTHTASSSGSNLTRQWTGTETGATVIQLRIDSDNDTSAPFGGYTGSATITKVVITGIGTNPFGGVGVSTDETFIGDIVGTPNREGYFGWLAVRDGTDVYYSRTENYWRTVKTTSLGAYASDLTFGIAIASHGQQVVMVGGPGSAIWRSTNWGSTFGTVAALNPHGGAITIPWAAGGGSVNVAATPKFCYFKGTAAGGTAQFVNYAGGTVALGTAQWPYESGGAQIHTFTTDGSYIMVGMQQGGVWKSSDAGATFGTAASLGGTAWGLNGSPQNSEFLLVFGPSTLKYTTTFGTAAWADLYSTYETELVDDEFDGGGTDLVSAQIDLNQLYNQEVTT
jgi:hypothetical protein